MSSAEERAAAERVGAELAVAKAGITYIFGV
jgi:hypothetical protein